MTAAFAAAGPVRESGNGRPGKRADRRTRGGGRRRLVRRLARRELRGSGGRSVLIVALFALPMAFLVMIISTLSWTANPSATVGAASGSLQTFRPGASELADWVPRDASRSLVISGTQASVTLNGVTVPVDAHVLDQTDARFTGMIEPIASNPSATQVALSRSIADQLHLGPGDQVTIDGHQYQVVAAVRAVTALDGILVPPGHPLAVGAQPSQVLLFGWQPTKQQESQLDDLGWYFVSRSSAGPGGVDPETALPLAVGLSALFSLASATLASAAFTIGARRQRRTLALLGCTGAPGRVLRRVMLASAWYLGLLGCSLGVTVGLAVLLVWHLWSQTTSPTPAVPFSYPWYYLPVPVVTALIAALVAGWMPARWVTTRGAVEAVRNAEAAPEPARFPWVGLALGIVGLGLAASPLIRGVRTSASGRGFVDPTPVIAPAVAATLMLFFGIWVSSGWLLDRLGRRHWRSLGVRLAMRDAARSRGRATSAVAATLAISTLAGVMLTSFSSLAATEVRDYQPSLPTHVAALDSARGGALEDSQIAAAKAALTSTVGPPRTEWRAMSFGEPGSSPGPGGRVWAVRELGDVTVNAPAALAEVRAVEFWTGKPVTAELADAIDRGVVIVFDPDLLVDGQVRLDWFTADGAIVEHITPGRYVPGVPGDQVPALIPQITATALSMPPVSAGQVFYDFGRPLSVQDHEAVQRALGATGLLVWVRMETGPEPYPVITFFGWGFVVILLIVALIVSTLTVVDAGSNYTTLAQIGASRSTLRWMAATQSWVTTSIGTLLGLMAGWLPAWLVISSGRKLLVPVLPWHWGLLMVVGVPLVAALIVALTFTQPDRRRV